MSDTPLGRPVSPGPALPPGSTPIHGRYTSLIPLHASHAAALYKHLGGPQNYWRWMHMSTAGFADLSECQAHITQWMGSERSYYVIATAPGHDEASEPGGLLCYHSVSEDDKRINIGGVILGDELRHTRQATEAFHLALKQAFELGYRRVEWRADSLNKASLAAAARLGFTFEGVLRNHMVRKGRSRDTVCFSIISDEWTGVKDGFELWLEEDNFEDGRQKRGLKECRLAAVSE